MSFSDDQFDHLLDRIDRHYTESRKIPASEWVKVVAGVFGILGIVITVAATYFMTEDEAKAAHAEFSTQDAVQREFNRQFREDMEWLKRKHLNE